MMSASLWTQPKTVCCRCSREEIRSGRTDAIPIKTFVNYLPQPNNPIFQKGLSGYSFKVPHREDLCIEKR
jgi:hypothetical protein